jgi:hypothetical protein
MHTEQVRAFNGAKSTKLEFMDKNLKKIGCPKNQLRAEL